MYAFEIGKQKETKNSLTNDITIHFICAFSSSWAAQLSAHHFLSGEEKKYEKNTEW